MEKQQIQPREICVPENLIRSNWYSDTYRTVLSFDAVEREWNMIHIEVPFSIERERELMRRFNLDDEALPEFYGCFREQIARNKRMGEDIQALNCQTLSQNIVTQTYLPKQIDGDGTEHFYILTEPMTPLTGSEWMEGNHIRLQSLMFIGERLLQAMKYAHEKGYTFGTVDFDNVYVQNGNIKIGWLGYCGKDGDLPKAYGADARSHLDYEVYSGKQSQSPKSDIQCLADILWAVLEGKHYSLPSAQSEFTPCASDKLFAAVRVCRKWLLDGNTDPYKVLRNALYGTRKAISDGNELPARIRMSEPAYLSLPLPESKRLVAQWEAEKAERKRAEEARLAAIAAEKAAEEEKKRKEQARAKEQQAARKAEEKERVREKRRKAVPFVVIACLLSVAAVLFGLNFTKPELLDRMKKDSQVMGQQTETELPEPAEEPVIAAPEEPVAGESIFNETEQQEENAAAVPDLSGLTMETSSGKKLYTYKGSVVNYDGTVNYNYKIDGRGNIVRESSGEYVIMAARTEEYVYISKISVIYLSGGEWHFTADTAVPEKMIYKLAPKETATKAMKREYTVWEADRDGAIAAIIRVEPANATCKQIVLDITGTDMICINSYLPMDETETVAADYMQLLNNTYEESFKTVKDGTVAVLDGKYYIDNVQRVTLDLEGKTLCGFTMTGYNVEEGNYFISVSAVSGDAKYSKIIQVTPLGTEAVHDPEAVSTYVPKPSAGGNTQTDSSDQTGETEPVQGSGTAESDTEKEPEGNLPVEEQPAVTETFAVSPRSITLKVGETAEIVFFHGCKFSSSNKAVAELNIYGDTVKAKGVGTCTLTYECTEYGDLYGQKATVTIVVTE